MLSVLEKIIFILVVVTALFFAFKEFFRKYKLISYGKKVNRFDKPVKRFFYMCGRIIFQICSYSRRPITGFFHSMIFWGFIVFMFVTINHVFEGFFKGLDLLGIGLIHKILIFSANFFAGMIIVAVFYFFIRRFIFKASSLDVPSNESFIILCLLFFLMMTFIFFQAYEIVNGLSEPETANFISTFVFNNILPVNGSGADFWLHFFWWFHILLIIGFGVFIPYSKHLHLIAGPINTVLKHNGVMAEIPVVNLEEQEKFGTPNIDDFTRKDLLDLFACAECGRCDDVCPAFNSEKDLSPKMLMHKLKENLFESEDILNGKEGNLKFLFANVISEEEVWDCTTCGACMEVCPMINEHIPKIMGMRQHAVLMESKFPEEFTSAFRGLENQGNPWGINADTREEWAKDLDIPHISEKKETDILFWVGCEASFDDHSQKSAKTFVRILKKAGVDFAFLGNEEKCCGDPARRTGHEYLYQIIATENIETLNKYKFSRIVTMCPHGYHILKNEYSKMGGNYNVLHYSELIQELIENNKIKLKKNSDKRITYHDPCYLGRYNKIYNAPRKILKNIYEGNLKEMKNNKKISFCCGAGGGGMWKEENRGERISHLRLKHAEHVKANTIVTTCPYCSIMFKDAINDTDNKNLKTEDLAQIVFDNLDI